MKSLDGVNKKNDVNNTASEAPEKNVKTESEKIDLPNKEKQEGDKIMAIFKGAGVAIVTPMYDNEDIG